MTRRTYVERIHICYAISFECGKFRGIQKNTCFLLTINLRENTLSSFFLNAYFHQIILLMWFPKCTKEVLFCIDNLPWRYLYLLWCFRLFLVFFGFSADLYPSGFQFCIHFIFIWNCSQKKRKKTVTIYEVAQSNTSIYWHLFDQFYGKIPKYWCIHSTWRESKQSQE